MNTPKITANISSTFPNLFEVSREKLLAILNGEIPLKDDIFERELRDLREKDKRREQQYLGGSLGRLAIVERGSDLNIEPKLQEEIGLLRKFLDELP